MTWYSLLYNQLELGNIFPQIKIQVQWLEIHPFTAQCLSETPGRETNIPQASQYSQKKKIRKIRRTVLAQKMWRWKKPGFPSRSLCFWSICEKNQNGTLTWEQACSKRAWRSRCERSPQSQNLRGGTTPGSPSPLEVVSPGVLQLTHTLVYTSSHLSWTPIRSQSVGVVHNLESMNLDACFTLLVTSAQASYLASLWVSVSLSASKCAECRVWCALVGGWEQGLDSD